MAYVAFLQQFRRVGKGVLLHAVPTRSPARRAHADAGARNFVLTRTFAASPDLNRTSAARDQ
jgi:hypothetical protein